MYNLHLNNLLPDLQSAYRPGFSTDTATLRVLSDRLQAVDEGSTAVSALFDLCAVFDMVDHGILLRRLKSSYGFDGIALQWFRSYLIGRTQAVHRSSQ